MLNKILCLIVILPICSCIGRNESSTLARENTESTVEFGASQIVEFTQESGEATSQLDISPDEKDGLADEKTQFIVVTNNNLEPPESRNYLLLCDINGSCSRIFETKDTISSVSDLRIRERGTLVVSIFEGSSISLHALNLDNIDEATEIEASGYSYFQDSNDSTILFINQQTNETNSTGIFTFNLEDMKKEDIFIPCEVHSARFGVSADEIFFNGFCNSIKALYSYDMKTKTTNTILDLPVDQFSISPDWSKVAYNYFTNIAQLELFLPGESRKVTNDKLSIASSFFTMWVDSDRLLFAQKVKGNEAEYFIWNFANNTISKADVPPATIALSRDLDFAVTTSDSNGLNIVNMQTHGSTAIILPSDQSANMVYFIDIVE
jgi:hypothetical protein